MPKLKPHDPLAPVRKRPARVKSFLLNPAALRNQGLDCPALAAFPQELFACKNLETLTIFRGLSGHGRSVIPPEIGGFRKLRALSLGGLGATALPAAIGDLRRLRILDLAYNESLKVLPDALGKLRDLETLSVVYSPLRALPSTIGQLRKLKRLAVSHVKAVPPEVFQLTRLEALEIPAVRRLGPGMGKLRKLRTLSISAGALTDVRAELPKLTHLTELWVSGRTRKVPAEIASLRALRRLDLGYLGLDALPDLRGLEHLETLNVAGNALTELSDLVLALPRLTTLEVSGNPLAPGEKRRVDALMRVAPGKRRAALAGTKVPKKAEPLVRIEQVTSINASLDMLVADAHVAQSFQGIGNADDADDDELVGSDWEKLTAALDGGPAGSFSLPGGKVLALTLGFGAGRVSVWAPAGEKPASRLVLFEGSFPEDEESLAGEDRALFLEHIASASRKAHRVGAVTVPSGRLVLMPSTDGCADVGRLLGRALPKPAVSCGQDRGGCLVAVEPGRYVVSLEDDVRASWGSGCRAFLTRKA